jgi:hypothetical protein
MSSRKLKVNIRVALENSTSITFLQNGTLPGAGSQRTTDDLPNSNMAAVCENCGVLGDEESDIVPG